MTDPIHTGLINGEKAARRDKVLIALAKERLSALGTEGDKVFQIDNFAFTDEGYEGLERLRSSIERLRCFVAPQRYRPGGYVGYLTPEEVGNAIDEVDYFVQLLKARQ